MLDVNAWKRYYGTFKSDPTKQVDFVDLELHADDSVCRDDANADAPIHFSDIQFQAGNQLTGWVPNTEEMLDGLIHTSDENVNVASPNIMPAILPTVYPDLQERMFNVVGRGHSVITLPNYYPEDWDKEILPSGVDFFLYPKEDFDVMRISTNVGAMLPEADRRYQSYITLDPDNADYWANHPLHSRYTHEFWIDGAAANTEIKIHASTRSFTVGGVEKPTAGIREFDINGWVFPINRMRHFLAPRGSIRFRIEFYKHITNYGGVVQDISLNDGGIGFHGTAKFRQWTYGGERI